MNREMQPEELVEIFASNVKANRLSLGLTQQELADRLDVYVPYISAIENAHRTPFLGNVANFAEALEISPEALLSPAEKISA